MVSACLNDWPLRGRTCASTSAGSLVRNPSGMSAISRDANSTPHSPPRSSARRSDWLTPSEQRTTRSRRYARRSYPAEPAVARDGITTSSYNRSMIADASCMHVTLESEWRISTDLPSELNTSFPMHPMIARALLLSAALLPLARPIVAQSVEYAAGTTRYRVSTTTKGSQTTPLGSSDFELGIQQQITLHLARQAKDTLLATVTLDSINVSGAVAMPDVSALRGAQFVSLVSPTGRVYSTKAPTNANPLIAQLAEGVARFLPT